MTVQHDVVYSLVLRSCGLMSDYDGFDLEFAPAVAGYSAPGCNRSRHRQAAHAGSPQTSAGRAIGNSADSNGRLATRPLYPANCKFALTVPCVRAVLSPCTCRKRQFPRHQNATPLACVSVAVPQRGTAPERGPSARSERRDVNVWDEGTPRPGRAGRGHDARSGRSSCDLTRFRGAGGSRSRMSCQSCFLVEKRRRLAVSCRVSPRFSSNTPRHPSRGFMLDSMRTAVINAPEHDSAAAS